MFVSFCGIRWRARIGQQKIKNTVYNVYTKYGLMLNENGIRRLTMAISLKSHPNGVQRRWRPTRNSALHSINRLKSFLPPRPFHARLRPTRYVRTIIFITFSQTKNITLQSVTGVVALYWSVYAKSKIFRFSLWNVLLKKCFPDILRTLRNRYLLVIMLILNI